MNAVTLETACISAGGSWTDSGGGWGSCRYPANNGTAISNCGANSSYTVTYEPNESIITVCSASSGGGGAVYGGCRNEVRGILEAPDTIYVCHGKNGQATFPTGACELKCSISTGLPSGPARNLPRHAVATVYVRVVDADGSPASDSYIVCFDLDEDLDTPAIYRYVSGAWIWQPASISGNKICTSASGDGSFFLGEAPSS